MSYDTKRRGTCGRKKNQGLNWVYDYKSGAFMHIFPLKYGFLIVFMKINFLKN